MRLRSDGAFLAAAACAFVVTRVAAMQPYLGSLDSINFALSLRDFDPARYQPHFPGYPVYVVLARALYALGLPAPTALELPAIGVGAIAMLALFFGCRRWMGALRAKLTVLLWIACPGLWFAAGQPASDGLGVSWFTLAIGLLAAWWPESAKEHSSRSRWIGLGVGALLGLGLGIRASYFPIVLGAAMAAVFATRRAGRDSAPAHLAVGLAFGIAAGTLLWLVPMALVLGFEETVDLATRAGTGHFTKWGGAASVAHSPAWSERLLLYAWSWARHGFGAEVAPRLGGIVSVCAACALTAPWVGRGSGEIRRRDVFHFVAVLGLPYVVWIVLGQNPEKPRHVLPLLVLTLPLLSAGFPGLESTKRAWRAWAFGVPVVLVLSMLWLGTERIALSRRHLAPSFQLVQHVATYEDPEGLVLYGGEEVRLFAYYAPWVRAKRAREFDDVFADMEGGLQPHRILVTTKVDGVGTLKQHPTGRLTLIRAFSRDPIVDPHDADLGLYELAENQTR